MFIEGIVNPPKSESDAERFEAEIRAAKDAGANVLRTVVLPGRRYEQFDSLEAFREAVARGRQSLLLAAPVVERHKVRLAVENHKDQRVDERLTLLKEISSEYVGACVDVGNSFSLLEDPLEAVKAYAPWAMTVHLKDQAVQSYDDGFLFADVPLGGGFLDLKQMVAELRRAKPDVRFSLETITRDPLRVPCLTEKYWATMPKVPGADLARTMRTVGVARATQLEAIESLRLEEQAAIEAAGIEQSLGYAKKELQL
ncbi:MAG: sugar phosphate isomerase/epimerase family protein, partial [Planctomycetota bacterium]